MKLFCVIQYIEQIITLYTIPPTPPLIILDTEECNTYFRLDFCVFLLTFSLNIYIYLIDQSQERTLYSVLKFSFRNNENWVKSKPPPLLQSSTSLSF